MTPSPHAPPAATGPAREHRRDVPADRDAALEAVAEAAEAWGAAWTRQGTGGELALPFLAGLHRGWLRVRVTTEPASRVPAAGASAPAAAEPRAARRGQPEAVTGGERTSVRLEVTERHEGVHWQAVVVLLFSVAGGILVVLWPFFPRLVPLAPFGALLALGGWFLVVSRLRSSGPHEFLELVEKVAESGPPPGG
ncbi:MAG TPA: hypothetical protein VF100_08540 [Thermoanaerobaculia bacterium]